MAKRTSGRRPKKGRRRGFFSKTRWGWATLILTGGLVALLVILAVREEPPPERPLPVQSQDPAPVERNPEVVAQDEVEAFLASLDLVSRTVHRDLSERPFRYRVEGDFPSPAIRDGLVHRLQTSDPRLVVEDDPDRLTLTIRRAGETLVEVSFHPEPLPVVPSGPAGPLVTIIMDDIGRTFYPVEVLLSLPQPVTMSILPNEPYAQRIAAMIAEAGREVMLHVPMEPQGYPAVNPGDDALMIRHGAAELQDRLRAFLARVPQAAGINNHMGSRFTEDEAGLSAVMEVIGERRMFVVDSLTTGKSRVAQLAGQRGIPYLERNVFLDNVADVEAIRGQIRKLADQARHHGFAVGICHPYPETLEALRRELPRLEAAGIEIVPVRTVLVQARNQKSGS